ncbi:hypothetical protein [Streptomyces bottropensis]|uniref:Uncharacterized protein n=1 Tax=Streptomyces bottropensis TaxID=42235 RepID=A0ABU8B1S2_9ACTN
MRPERRQHRFALVGEIDPAVSSKDAGEVDLAGLAERTVRIRAELRQPID